MAGMELRGVFPYLVSPIRPDGGMRPVIPS